MAGCILQLHWPPRPPGLVGETNKDRAVMISWGGEPRGWEEKQGRLPRGGAVQLRPESREVSHKGMEKAVQGRGLDVQRPKGRENWACRWGDAEFWGSQCKWG